MGGDGGDDGSFAVVADRRRARRGVLAGAACLLLLAIAVPQLTGPGTEDALSAARPASGPAPGQAPGFAGGGAHRQDGGILDRPPRGSLADDRAFLEGVRTLPWVPDPPPRTQDGRTFYLPDPPAETRSVVFAGEVSSQRWALVVGSVSGALPDSGGLPSGSPEPDQLVAAWFVGPAGAAPGQLTLRSGPMDISADWPVALTDPRTGALVVVAEPGDRVEVSERPEIAADGSTSREWREVDTVDGIAVTRVSPFARPWDASTSYRVLRDGRTQARDVPWSISSEPLAPAVPIEYPRGRPSPLGERAAAFAAEHLLAELGLSPAQVQIAAQWVGGLPDGGPAQAAIVSVTLPSGAVAVEGQALLPEGVDGAPVGAFCGQAILPAGPPAERRVQAMTCEVIDYPTGAPVSTSLVAVGPPEVALIRTYDGDRTFLGEFPAADGVVAVPLPPGTDAVEAVTAGGVSLGRVDLLAPTSDFGD